MIVETILSVREVPCSHRRFRHSSPERRIHGYARDYSFTLRGERAEGEVFPIDFGELGWLESFVREFFDHTLVLDEGDPVIPEIQKLAARYDFCSVTIIPSGSLEGTAAWLLENLGERMRQFTKGKVWIHSVEVRESSKTIGRCAISE